MLTLHRLAQTAYHRMPPDLQDLVLTSWGYWSRSRRYGREFHKRLQWLRSTEFTPADAIREYQDTKVRAMVRHAFDTVPYYRRAMSKAGVTPADITSQADLTKLPVLSKAAVRQWGDELVSSAYHRRGLRVHLTSGTTGTPLRILVTPEAEQFQWAVWWRHRARFGLTLGDPVLTFGARLPVPIDASEPPFWRRNRSINQTYLSTYHLKPRNLAAIAAWLQGQEFAFFTGYPSAMYVLANYLRENSISLTHPPRWIVCGSDALIPTFERVLGEVFQAPVTDNFGSAEACGNFARCEHGRYHLDWEFGAVELIPVPGPEGRCRMLFTGFANPAMPLIRYDLGDIGVPASGPCPCGRKSLTLDRIEGRIEDYIRTVDGAMVVGMNQVLEWAPGIEEAQIIQRRLDGLIVRVVPSRRFKSSDLDALEYELRQRVGRDMAIGFEVVDAIPRSRSGKYRAVISELPMRSAEEQEHHRLVADEID